MNWFSSLPSSPIVALVLLVLAVASIVLAVILFIKGRRVKALSWAISTTNVIGPDTPPLPELSIHYAHEAVGSLSLSSVSIWNAGTESISGNEISPAMPLALITNSQEVRILDCTVTLASNKAAGITTQHKDHEHVDICFHYLNTGDGCVMRVIHTGTTSDDLTVSGGIQGMKTIRRVRPYDGPLRSSGATLAAITLGLLTVVVLGTVFPLPGRSTSVGWTFWTHAVYPGLPFWLFVGLYWLITVIPATFIIQKYIRPRLQTVPPEFNVTIRP